MGNQWVCVGGNVECARSVNEALCQLVFLCFCVCVYLFLCLYTRLICMAPCPIASTGLCKNKDFPFAALLCLQGMPDHNQLNDESLPCTTQRACGCVSAAPLFSFLAPFFFFPAPCFFCFWHFLQIHYLSHALHIPHHLSLLSDSPTSCLPLPCGLFIQQKKFTQKLFLYFPFFFTSPLMAFSIMMALMFY